MKINKKMCMKVCLVNNLFAPFERGGAEKVVGVIASEIVRQGHDVFVVSSRPYFSGRVSEGKFRVYRLRSLFWSLNKIPLMVRFFWHVWDSFDVINYFQVRAILKKERPDVVFGHNLKGLGFLIPFACKGLNIRFVHALHDIALVHPSGLLNYGDEKKIESIFAKVYSHLNVWLFRGVGGVVSPSRWLLEMHLRRGFFESAQQLIALNPVGEIAREGCDVVNRRKQLLFVGQIEEHKGVFDLIEAFGGVGGDWELLIVGDGSRVSKLKRVLRGASKVQYLGRLDKAGVLRVMRESSLVVVPSVCFENSPTVIYEAFVSGVNVIASRIGGVAELVYEEFLFEAGNVGNLRKKIKEVIKKKGVKLDDVYRFNESGVDVRKYVEQILTKLVK